MKKERLYEQIVLRERERRSRVESEYEYILLHILSEYLVYSAKRNKGWIRISEWSERCHIPSKTYQTLCLLDVGYCKKNNRVKIRVRTMSGEIFIKSPIEVGVSYYDLMCALMDNKDAWGSFQKLLNGELENESEVPISPGEYVWKRLDKKGVDFSELCNKLNLHYGTLLAFITNTDDKMDEEFLTKISNEVGCSVKTLQAIEHKYVTYIKRKYGTLI